MFVGVTGFTHEPAGRGPVKALAPATSTEHTIADFILIFRCCWLAVARTRERGGWTHTLGEGFSYPPPVKLNNQRIAPQTHICI